MNTDKLTVGLAQISPVWLNFERTLDKILDYVEQAAEGGCDLVVFGEALLPGYPFWLELTGGARFNSQVQKELYAHYLANAVQVETGGLEPLCQLARARAIAVYLGCIERPKDRGAHSLYCSLVYIDKTGTVCSVHRKLMPTYEERLVWATGDGHGLQTHPLGAFTVGGLNCWENWMPLPRAALYAQGEDLHIAVWPGGLHNQDSAPFLAKEGRSYVVSVSGILRRTDVPETVPYADKIIAAAPEYLANGGSCLVAPDGEFILEPLVNEEQLRIATIDHARVREERQNFDAAGHYSRPDVTRLSVNRKRQSTLDLED